MDDIYWELIVKKLSDALSKQDEDKLRAWLKTDPSHIALYRQAEKLIELAESSLNDMKPDTETEWQKLKEMMQLQNDVTTPVKPLPWNKRHRFRWWHTAAACAILSVLGWLLYMPSQSPMLKWTEIRTGDTLREVILHDSSRVCLNRNSVLRYTIPFADSERVVWLNGEAYFVVQANARQPFRVCAGSSETLVLGTSFDVKAYEAEGKIEVFVEEGTVLFTANVHQPEKKMRLNAGSVGLYDKKTKKVSTYKYRKKQHMKWLNKMEGDFRKLIKKADKKMEKFLKQLK